MDDCSLSYVVLVDPPLPAQPTNCTVDCNTHCRRFTVREGDPHNITVIAQNCDGRQNGSESHPCSVAFQCKFQFCAEINAIPLCEGIHLWFYVSGGAELRHYAFAVLNKLTVV